MPNASLNAKQNAVSSAAELDMPADSGTSESMAASNAPTSILRLRSSEITPRM